VERLRGRGAVLAINSAYKIAPFADMLYWADRSWVYQHRFEIPKVWRGGLLVSRTDPCSADVNAWPWPVHQLRHEPTWALSVDPAAVAGFCSGANAINIARHAGAAPTILLGFEGRSSGNWHNDHKAKPKVDPYPKHIVPSLKAMAAELARSGSMIVNCTPNSALSFFPYLPIDEVLATYPVRETEPA
jgi:hypothetical protein